MGSPIVVALIAALITVILYISAKRIPNRFARGAAQLASVIVGILVAGGLAADNIIANQAGEYYAYTMFGVAVVAALFGKKKKGATDGGAS